MTNAVGRKRVRVVIPLLGMLLAVTLFGFMLGGAGQEARQDADHSDSCVTVECHVEYESATYMHRPVSLGICKFCHRSTNIERHEFRLAREGGNLCSVCHWEKEAKVNAHSGLGPSECIICHDPHGTEHRFQLRAARIQDVCTDCHAQLFDTKGVLHTPVATGPCTVCHDPHEPSAEQGMTSIAERCFQCHESTRDGLETLQHIHEPVQSFNCDLCHDPHGSDNESNLVENVPTLCFGCHEEIRNTVQTAKHPHSIAGEPGGCLTCHTPHASSVRFGLKSDPFTLCQSCHSQDIVTADGETISGTAHQLESKLYLHGPVRQRDCGACHNSHGSDHHRLLFANYTPEFYARFDLENFRLCFSCHPQRGVLTEQTTNLTDFRNGNENLHYLHINKPEKGRTCRACHATHGSDLPKHIADWAKFGQWEMPIRYEKTATGGSCDSGCHGPRAYDRETPVDNHPDDEPDEPPAPDEDGDE